jgi:hypothetical protein
MKNCGGPDETFLNRRFRKGRFRDFAHYGLILCKRWATYGGIPTLDLPN